MNPCWFCPASRAAGSPHSLTDLQRAVGWKSNLVSIVEYFIMPLTSHPIAQLMCFSRFLVPGDMMHTGAGGVLCWFVGSVLWELVFDGPWPGTQEDRLQALWEHIVFTYGHLDSRSRLPHLIISMFQHGDNCFTCFLRGKLVTPWSCALSCARSDGSSMT